MDVWRLARRRHAALDGEGARLAGGRWNSPGRPVVYTSASLSLAAIEYLVHTSPDLVPADLTAFRIRIPAAVPVGALPWGDKPPAGWARDIGRCRRAGDAWLEAGAEAVLRAPSAVIPGEWNYLVNPVHRQAGRIRVVAAEGFRYDARVWK